MSHSPIPGSRLRDAPYTTVSEIALGLTLYLDDAMFWGREGAGRALEAFLRHAPANRLQWYTTSTLTEWHRTGQASFPQLAAQLSHWMIARPRHLFSFDLVDDTVVRTAGFAYREYDPDRGGARASILEITLPQETDPEVLLAATEEISGIGAWWCGIGGYVVRWNPWELNAGLTTAHTYAQRYLGLDVSNAEDTSWYAVDGLPGTNWLTLVSRSLASRRKLQLGALAEHEWVHDVKTRPVAGGMLLRAGAEPTSGDRNALEYPKAYAEVARALAPHFVDPPPELGGQFWRNKDTRAWQRRFIEPDGWQ